MEPNNKQDFMAEVAAVNTYPNVVEDMFAQETDEPIEFANFSGENCSNALGDRLFKGAKERIKKRQDARAKRKQTRADAMLGKSKAKQTLAQAQIEAAKAAALGVGADTATANALAAQQPVVNSSATGMSTGMKVGIAVGAVAFVGIIILVIYKAKHKK